MKALLHRFASEVGDLLTGEKSEKHTNRRMTSKGQKIYLPHTNCCDECLVLFVVHCGWLLFKTKTGGVCVVKQKITNV